MRVALSVDQLSRRQPGGIGSYVRGLARALGELLDVEVVGVGPRDRGDGLEISGTLGLDVRLLTRVWRYYALGVPADADVVHATSMAGPFAGGSRQAVHSVALHDLLWRDEPTAATRAGARFHEGRLQLLKRRGDLKLALSSPLLRDRLLDEGFAPERLFSVRLGVDDTAAQAATSAAVAAFLATHGVVGPYTFYAGTREPRKNVERLVAAHRLARSQGALGPLVLAGPEGWGAVQTGDAVIVGVVPRDLLLGLYRDAAVVAYVPRAEGWGLPPVEALHMGARVVASWPCPSVSSNDEVVHVDPLDTDAIGAGLVTAAALTVDDVDRARRRASVADLSWRNSALDHLAMWQ